MPKFRLSTPQTPLITEPEDPGGYWSAKKSPRARSQSRRRARSRPQRVRVRSESP